MAKNEADNMTGELFTPATVKQIVEALHTQLAVLKRRANTEKNEQIKTIINNEITSLMGTINRMQGL